MAQRIQKTDQSSHWARGMEQGVGCKKRRQKEGKRVGPKPFNSLKNALVTKMS